MNGIVIYNGPSQWDGEPIIVVVTGLKRRSHNPKTGDMLQSWILMRDIHPHEAVVAGSDESICGDCIHRQQEDGTRSCYVSMNAPSAVWSAFHRGSYETVDPEVAGDMIAGRKIRVGAYGDPAMVPVDVWKLLIRDTVFTTGYTHQWREMSVDYAAFCMASADTAEDVLDAEALGYRTFRCITEGGSLLEQEIVCPASAEAGKLTTCEKCGLCRGSMRDRTNTIPSVVITVHGRGARYFNESQALRIQKARKPHAERDTVRMD